MFLECLVGETCHIADEVSDVFEIRSLRLDSLFLGLILGFYKKSSLRSRQLVHRQSHLEHSGTSERALCKQQEVSSTQQAGQAMADMRNSKTAKH